MACFEPLIRFERFDSSVHIESRRGYDDLSKLPYNRYKSIMQIPCGKCDGCRADQARHWADRLMLEASLHEQNWFVTLTFNDKYLELLCPQGLYGLRSLDKRIVQLFLKRLRRKVEPDKIRYYCSGEYGSFNKTGRPHYHLIIFGLNLPEDDLMFLRKNNLGQDYFSSKLISECWCDPETGESYGFNVVGKVDYQSCRYTARYIQKKLNGPDKLLYEKAGIQAPFSIMSRGAHGGHGLAYEYMLQHPEWKDSKFIYLSTPNGSLTVSSPKYFEKVLESSDPELAEQRKEFRRELNRNFEKLESIVTDKNHYDYVKVIENNLKKSLRVLTTFEQL